MSEDESANNSSNDYSDYSGSESGSENEEEEILNQLKDVPFETLIRLQKKSQERLASETKAPGTGSRGTGAGGSSGKSAKRKSKDAPAEMSSKVPVSRFRQVVAPQQKAPARDPRFDSLSGVYNPGLYKKAYGFLDEMRSEEISKIKESIKNLERHKNAQGGRYKEELDKERRALNVLEQQRRTEAERERRQEVKRTWRKEMEERVKAGKNPYFLKRKEEKRLRAVQRFNDLKKKGGYSAVDAAIKKRARKLSAKSMKSLPSFRGGKQ